MPMCDLRPSGRVDWNTPSSLISAVYSFAGTDGIGLDPCSNPESVVHARVSWQLEKGDDGLTRSWTGHGLVFVNPPYGRRIGRWTTKMRRSGAEVIGLLPARTD